MGSQSDEGPGSAEGSNRIRGTLPEGKLGVKNRGSEGGARAEFPYTEPSSDYEEEDKLRPSLTLSEAMQWAHIMAAAAWLVCGPSVAFAGAGDQTEHATRESHAVRDSLVAGANKVGDALKSGAQTVGPPIDRGLATAKKAVEKSANAVGTALKETGNRIEQKVSSKSGGDKPGGSTPK